jgi:predicted RNase H-like HicB family nuclease
MDLGFTVRILKEDGTFIAHVPELDVSSCGDTEVDTRRNIADAVQGFLQTAREHGTSTTFSRKAAIDLHEARRQAAARDSRLPFSPCVHHPQPFGWCVCQSCHVSVTREIPSIAFRAFVR